MPFKIGVGINCWDEPQGILRILKGENLYDWVDYIFIIEGRYKGRIDEPQNNPKIMDELKNGYPKIIYERMDNAKQIDKRNRYWELAEEYNLDWFIVCDSDEWLEIPDPKVFRDWLEKYKDYDARCFPVNTFIERTWRMARPRLFRNPRGIRHKQLTNKISHGSLWDENNREIIVDMYKYHKEERGKYKYVDGLYMIHDKKIRSRERSIRDEVYYTQTPDR